MKRLTIYLLLFLSVNSVNAHTTTIPLNDIKDSIATYLNMSKDFVCNEYYNNNIWEPRRDKYIQEGQGGIFLFDITSSHYPLYFLLVKEKQFLIVDTNSPIEINFKLFLDFF